MKLYNTGDSVIQHSVMAYMRIKSKEEWINVFIYYFVLHLKLTQHCKSVIAPIKIKKQTQTKQKNSTISGKSRHIVTPFFCSLPNFSFMLSDIFRFFYLPSGLNPLNFCESIPLA